MSTSFVFVRLLFVGCLQLQRADLCNQPEKDTDDRGAIPEFEWRDLVRFLRMNVVCERQNRGHRYTMSYSGKHTKLTWIRFTKQLILNKSKDNNSIYRTVYFYILKDHFTNSFVINKEIVYLICIQKIVQVY